jgi:effector-binding domain-containing protein
MKILKIIGVILALLVAVLVVIGLVAPKSYELKRDIVINTPVAAVFNTVSHFSEFPKWSPWQELDPNMKTNIEGTDGTVGAKYSWKGNGNAGAGSMTITKLEQEKYLEQNLEFLEPFPSKAVTYFTLETAEGGTKLTWGMKGENNFMSRIFLTLMGGMDAAVGKDFEKGLAKLKTLCESSPGSASAYEVKEIDWPGKDYAIVRSTVKFQDVSGFFQKNLPVLFESVTKAKGNPGIPVGIFYKYDEKAGEADMAAGVPYEEKVDLGKTAVVNVPASKAYQIDYYGAYENMQAPYEAMGNYLKEKFQREDPDMVIEEYVSDPTVEKDTSQWLTRIYFFVAEEAKK